MGKWYTSDNKQAREISFIDSPAVSLQQPCRQICALQRERVVETKNPATRQRRTIPWCSWSYFLLIAFGGSAIYGASLRLALPEWQLLQGALWITLAAGCGWLIFIPTLRLLTKCRLVVLFHASLVTMAYGEAVLITGAFLNLLLSLTNNYPFNAGWFNFVIVACSNIVMAMVLSLQLRQAKVSIKKTLLLWMLVLNGSGAIFFWVLRGWLQGGR